MLILKLLEMSGMEGGFTECNGWSSIFNDASLYPLSFPLVALSKSRFRIKASWPSEVGSLL